MPNKSDDRFITLRIVSDVMEAEMLKDVLAQEGIVATTVGTTHNAMLGGLIGAALQVPLQVRAADAERARAILDALSEYDEAVVSPESEAPPPVIDRRPAARRAAAADLTRGEGPYREGPLDRPLSSRKKGVAIALAIILPMMFFLFGAGHFYARSYARGFALLGAAVIFGAVAFTGGSWALFGLPLIALADAMGASRAIEANKRLSSDG